MKKPNQDDEPFFITEEIAAEMIAGGYEFELPPIPCTIRLRDVLERMTDAELALQPGEIADQERERCRPVSQDQSGICRVPAGEVGGRGRRCPALRICGGAAGGGNH